MKTKQAQKRTGKVKVEDAPITTHPFRRHPSEWRKPETAELFDKTNRNLAWLSKFAQSDDEAARCLVMILTQGVQNLLRLVADNPKRFVPIARKLLVWPAPITRIPRFNKTFVPLGQKPSRTILEDIQLSEETGVKYKFGQGNRSLGDDPSLLSWFAFGEIQILMQLRDRFLRFDSWDEVGCSGLPCASKREFELIRALSPFSMKTHKEWARMILLRWKRDTCAEMTPKTETPPDTEPAPCKWWEHKSFKRFRDSEAMKGLGNDNDIGRAVERDARRVLENACKGLAA